MCEGKFHTLFMKSRRLRSLVSLYSSDSASEWAHEHQNHLLFSLLGLIHSYFSFSWWEVPTGSCWHLKVKPLFLSTAFPGDGPGTSVSHFPLLWNSQLSNIRWPRVFFCYFINRWHWSLPHLYSEVLPSMLRLRNWIDPSGFCLVSSQSLFPDCS